MIITTTLIITAFCIFLGWYLYRMCRRAIDVEHYELRCRGEDEGCVVGMKQQT